MREIKFRVWNARAKEMCIPDHIANDIDMEKYQVMQFTGLLDKQGKEIYEGDIVIPFYTVAGYGQKQEVRWGIGAWEPFDGNCDSDHTNRYEIIGNIYENPELIKTT